MDEAPYLTSPECTFKGFNFALVSHRFRVCVGVSVPRERLPVRPSCLPSSCRVFLADNPDIEMPA